MTKFLKSAFLMLAFTNTQVSPFFKHFKHFKDCQGYDKRFRHEELFLHSIFTNPPSGRNGQLDVLGTREAHERRYEFAKKNFEKERKRALLFAGLTAVSIAVVVAYKGFAR